MRPTQPADVISAEPPKIPSWSPWVAAALLAAALAGAIVVTLHYRDEVAALRRRAHPARAAAPRRTAAIRPDVPIVGSEKSVLPSAGPLTGDITVFTVRLSGGLTQVIVTAQITGGRPRRRYELLGGDCAAIAPSRMWAGGRTDSRGSAELTGPVLTVSPRDEYYLILGGPGLGQRRPGPAVHGYFAAHGLTAVPGGAAPCIP